MKMYTTKSCEAMSLAEIIKAKITKLDVSKMVREFHEVMDVPLDAPVEGNNRLLALRQYLLSEEAAELDEAIEGLYGHFYEPSQQQWRTYKAHVLKELADLVYVAYGTAVAFGWDLDTAVQRVHQSNMTKLVDGQPLRRDDGKVLKGPNYEKPYLEDLV